MGGFIFGLILLVAGVVGWIVFKAIGKNSRKGSNADVSRLVSGAIGTLGLVAGFVLVVTSVITVVPARNIGVVNTFGKVNGALPNGMHIVGPWSSVENVDATIQNMNLNADLGQWANKTCTTVAVRLGNGQTACLDLTLQWNIEEDHASDLWQRYRGANNEVVSNIGTNVVERELRRALNDVFANYDPFAAMVAAQNQATGTNATASTTTASTLSTDQLASDALAKLKQNVDPGITVDKLLISLVHYDSATQLKLDALAQAIADTRIATQQKATAEQIKEANDLLAASASSSNTGVEFQNCLSLIQKLAAAGQLSQLPVNTVQCAIAGATTAPIIVNPNTGH